FVDPGGDLGGGHAVVAVGVEFTGELEVVDGFFPPPTLLAGHGRVGAELRDVPGGQLFCLVQIGGLFAEGGLGTVGAHVGRVGHVVVGLEIGRASCRGRG